MLSGLDALPLKKDFLKLMRRAVPSFLSQFLGSTTASAARTALDLSIRGHLSGLTLSTAGSSATFSVAAGAATDSTAAASMVLAASISKTTSAWAVGTGNGSLDTGAIANSTWYHVHLIRRTDTGVVDVLTSLSASAPTMPTNYTQSRRIGSMKTNGSAQWTSFIQDGDFFQWLTPVLDVNSTTAGVAAVTRTLASVPTGVNVRAFLDVVLISGGAGEALYLSDLATTDLVPSNSAAPGGTMWTSGAATAASQASVRTNTSAQIRSRQTVGGATETLRISSLGWFDTRGRDA